jgi:hypothetical protein
MSKLETAEYALVILIMVWQLQVFLRNKKRIYQYSHAIPDQYGISASPVRLTLGIDQIHPEQKVLVADINAYLEACDKGAPDFSLIRDITERHTNIKEETINQTLSVPLYLGLMGTMIGIVVGLWNMSEISQNINSEGAGDAVGDGINILLGGVKIAMIASFTGILFTVLASSLLFIRARAVTEQRKNRLYNFIQSKLMPRVSEEGNQAIQGLQNNLIAFSQHFDQNLTRMESILNNNRQDLEVQRDILTKLDAIDINQFSRANVSILQELLRGTHKLEQFNKYLTNMTNFVGASQTLTDAFNQMLTRTTDIEGVLKNIDTHFDMSAELLLFLKSHFAQLEARGGLIQQALIGVDTVLDDGLNQLKEHVSAKLSAIKEMTTVEQAELSKALEGSREGLSKLGYIETISTKISGYENTRQAQLVAIDHMLKELLKSITEIADTLKEKKKRTIISTLNRVLFKRKDNK